MSLQDGMSPEPRIGNFMLVIGVLMALSFFQTHAASSVAVGAVFAFWGATLRAYNVASVMV